MGYDDRGNSAADFLRRFWIVTGLLIPLLILTETGLSVLGFADFPLRPYLQFIVATAIFYFSLVFFKHAGHEIKAGNYGMMTLVSLALGAGYLFSVVSTLLPAVEAEFYLEISTLVWVLLFGHFLEAKSSVAAGDALQEVRKLLPEKAYLETKEGLKEVALESLAEGDIVIVRPGEKVPADGKIVEGNGGFGEAHLTGESKPVSRAKGDPVAAGAISLDGSVRVKLERVGPSSTIGRIQELILQARKTKPTAQRVADRASRWLTFTALGVSIITFFIWLVIFDRPLVFSTTLAITVLVIACPHALGLAIPTVITIAARLAVENGIFIKNMAKLEVAKDVDWAIFDKTGTLTKGQFSVKGVEFLTKVKDKKSLLSVIAGLESHSFHPIGLAIVDYFKKKQISPARVESIKNWPGLGIAGKVDKIKYFVGNQRLMTKKNLVTQTVLEKLDSFETSSDILVFAANSRQIFALVFLGDQVKPESKQAVSQLHQLGIRVAMLTGDTQKVADSVARQLGIDLVFAQVLPEDKYRYVKGLQDKGNRVVMVGDGVNDAPALVQADVGVAVGAGTDVAVEAGDVVLIRNNPKGIVSLIILSRKVYRKMIENLAWATGYNFLAIPAAAGVFAAWNFFLKPQAGAVLMSLSSVIVVINALTLKRAKLV
jgi:P-type Cu2+ transporter